MGGGGGVETLDLACREMGADVVVDVLKLLSLRSELTGGLWARPSVRIVAAPGTFPYVGLNSPLW